MANTSAFYARIDTDLKNNAEEILAQLGITPSCILQMLYSQIILRNGVPFDLQLPYSKPIAMGSITQSELDVELAKGIESMKNAKTYSVDEIDDELSEEFGI